MRHLRSRLRDLSCRRKPRLLAVCPMPPTWGGAAIGGAEVFYDTLLQELSAGNYPVEPVGVLVTNSSSSEVDSNAVPAFHPPPFAPKRVRPQVRAFFQEVMKATRADVVMFNYFHTGWAFAHADTEPRAVAVATIPGWPERGELTNTQYESMHERAEAALPAMDIVIHPTQESIKQGRLRGYVHAESRLIPYAVGHEFMDIKPAPSNRRSGVVSLGRMVKSKNADLLIKAAALSDFTVTFIGDGEERRYCEKLASQLGLGERVRFEGHVPLAEVQKALASAEVLCNPSERENLSIALLEALACGTPIVGYPANVREVSDLIGECGEPLTDLEPGAIADAIDRVRSRPWDHPRIREGALAQFSPPSVATAYCEVFLEAISRRRSA